MPELSLCASINIDNSRQPEWLHLVPAGEVRTLDGRGPYRIDNPHVMIAASMANGKLVLDENHSTDLAAPKGLPSPACGWIVEMQQRADGIWGRVEWTAQAQRDQAWRSYRGVSPVIVHRKDGTILAIARASLTNTPNLTGLTSLHSKETDMDLRSTLIKVLDLQDAAGDREIINKVKFLVKHVEGRDVAMMSGVSPMADGQKLALQATAYQTKMAGIGMPVDYATAVRAVADGKAI